MKKIYLLILLALLPMLCAAKDNQQLKFQSFREAPDEGGVNLVTQMIENWPTASTDNTKDAALIRVKFENLPPVEAKEIVFTTSRNNFLRADRKPLDGERREVWLWVDPVGDTYINAKSPKGYTARYPIKKALKPRHVYDMVLRNDKTVAVSFITTPEGAVVTLETGQKTTTPEPMKDVALGKHVAVISLDGRRMLVDTIEVAESAVKFPVGKSAYDLRSKKLVSIKSDPDATLFIDGERVGQTPMSTELAHGAHTLVAVALDNPVNADTLAINVDAASPVAYNLTPVKKVQFECMAYYAGRPVQASLYVDGKFMENHTLTYPVGTTYNMEMTYGAAKKRRKIKVYDGMKVRQDFKLAAKNTFTWPWQREYDATPMGVAIGYVTKQWVSSGQGEKKKEDIWGNEGWTSGMQFGLHFQPCFSWGLGFYSGLFYEIYFSWNDDWKDQTGYGEFIEHSLYIPVHAYYRIPFANKVALSVHGGIGMNIGVAGELIDEDGYYENVSIFGDEVTQFPKRFNLAGEIAVDMRVGPVMVTFSYSKGLTDHKFYTNIGEYKTVQNKWGISASWVFGTGE